MAGRLLSAITGGLVGAGATLATHNWAATESRQTAFQRLERDYTQGVQDHLAFIGVQRAFLKAHGVSLEDFMRDFPHQREYPGQFPGPDKQDYLTIRLWMDIRTACHRLNGYWDSFIEGWEAGSFMSTRHGGHDERTIPQLRGRWANRALNFCELVEPLERANLGFMRPDEEYKTPARFRKLYATCQSPAPSRHESVGFRVV